jgi:hypothetical protein
MKYTFVISSVATKKIPTLIKIRSGIQNLMRGGDTQTHRQDGGRTSLN